MRPMTFAFFRITDPMPAAARTWKMISMAIGGGKRSKAAPAVPAAQVKPATIGLPRCPEDQLMVTEADAEAAAA
jgi:hypothetical protein